MYYLSQHFGALYLGAPVGGGPNLPHFSFVAIFPSFENSFFERLFAGFVMIFVFSVARCVYGTQNRPNRALLGLFRGHFWIPGNEQFTKFGKNVLNLGPPL